MPSTNQDYIKVRYMTVEEMQQLPNNQLVEYIKQSAYYANKRRDKVMKYYEDNPNAVTAPSYKELDKPEKMKPTFKAAKEREFYGWSTYNFDIPKNVNLNTIPNLKDYLIGKLIKNIRFLDNKTSTVNGIKRMLDKFEQRLEKRGVSLEAIKNVSTDDEKYRELWKLYNKVTSKYDTNKDTNLNSNELQKEIVEILSSENYDYEEAIKTLEEKEEYQYNKTIKNRQGDDIVDKFTDLGGIDNEFETDRL